jgi:Bacterial CdiA-CT RNAse A domain
MALRAIEGGLLRLKWLAAATRFELAMLRHARALKYSPDQPRVPAGNPDGGQWTDGGGGSSSPRSRTDPAAAGGGRNDPRVLSDVTPDNYDKPGTRLAQNDRTSGRPVDLREEEQRGGHAIADHVAKSEGYLLNTVHQQALSSLRRGDYAEGLKEGSFTSIEAANKLVNSTIARNAGKVQAVASGAMGGAQLEAQFKSPTGYEAYAATERSRAYIRPTNGVYVVIARDSGAAKGYRVLTAYPISIGR